MANRLKHYRVEAEMTQARLAKVVEVTQPMFPALPKKGRDRDFQGRGQQRMCPQTQKPSSLRGRHCSAVSEFLVERRPKGAIPG